MKLIDNQEWSSTYIPILINLAKRKNPIFYDKYPNHTGWGTGSNFEDPIYKGLCLICGDNLLKDFRLNIDNVSEPINDLLLIVQAHGAMHLKEANLLAFI